MPAKPRHKPEHVVRAIKGTGGVKSTIAQNLGVTRNTITNYANRWKTVKAAIDEEKESALDFAESQLIKEIQAGNFQAIKYFLSTMGRERGYFYRQEIAPAPDKEFVFRLIEEDAGTTDQDETAA